MQKWHNLFDSEIESFSTTVTWLSFSLRFKHWITKFDFDLIKLEDTGIVATGDETNDGETADDKIEESTVCKAAKLTNVEALEAPDDLASHIAHIII